MILSVYWIKLEIGWAAEESKSVDQTNQKSINSLMGALLMLFQQIIYFINLVWSPALEREQSPLYVIDITTIFLHKSSPASLKLHSPNFDIGLWHRPKELWNATSHNVTYKKTLKGKKIALQHFLGLAEVAIWA